MTSNRNALGRLAGAAGLVFAMASADGAQNYLANGDFDADLSGWQLSGSPLPTWTMVDYVGYPLSGAAQVENDAATASARTYPLMQCVTPPPGHYTFTVRAFLPLAQTAGRLVMSYGAYHSANCTGGANALGGDFLQQVGVWQQKSMSFEVVDLPGASALLMLGIEKDASGGSLVGQFDGIELISDVVFASDFES